MISRRHLLFSGAALAFLRNAQARPSEESLGYTPVVTPNGSTLPWKMVGGVKEFHLVAEPIKREFAKGMVINCWGYNGQSPGPTIEAVEGDRVRILVSNKLPEPTSVHWHGIHLPNGMDGVGGLTQPHIKPGETYAYELTLKQNGTFMYHPHSDEMVQMAMGMEGFLIIHPRKPERQIDRDFCIFLQEWFVAPGSATPNPNIMTDFNLFTFNSRVYPGTAPLVIKRNQRVRIRFANLSMDSHPIHFHGHTWWITGTDGGPIPKSAWIPETTVNVAPGTTRDVEFVANNPGDWPLHCHKNHHVMNMMSHDVPNMMGVEQKGVEEKVRKILPGYMSMGSSGMGEMAEMNMGGPKNWVPMMSGEGQFGAIGMGGMFTVMKIRDGLTSYADPGHYRNPAGTVAWKVS
jgi:FtsP/CotA-like multicopper oxidase with cupredoxin domain